MMNSYTTLLGAEEVGRAGYNMRDAATTFAQAVGQQQANGQDFIQRLERIVERFEESAEKLGVALENFKGV